MQIANVLQPHKGIAPLFAAITLCLTASVAQANTASRGCFTRQEITAKTMGVLQKVYVRNGDVVKKGDLLLELDSRLARTALKEAQAGMEIAQANLQLAEDGVKRLEKIQGSESFAEQQYVEAKLKLAQARAAKLQAEAATERMRAQLDDSLLRAELPGTVRGLPTILNMFVQTGQSLGRVELNEKCER